MIESLVMVNGSGREVLLTWTEYGRQLVATASARVIEPEAGHGEIRRVFVKPGWRMSGYGRALVGQAMRELYDAGCHRVFCSVPGGSNLEDGVAFFEAMGFQRIPGSEFDPPLGSVVMMAEIEQLRTDLSERRRG